MFTGAWLTFKVVATVVVASTVLPGRLSFPVVDAETDGVFFLGVRFRFLEVDPAGVDGFGLSSGGDESFVPLRGVTIACLSKALSVLPFFLLRFVAGWPWCRRSFLHTRRRRAKFSIDR